MSTFSAIARQVESCTAVFVFSSWARQFLEHVFHKVVWQRVCSVVEPLGPITLHKFADESVSEWIMKIG